MSFTFSLFLFVSSSYFTFLTCKRCKQKGLLSSGLQVVRNSYISTLCINSKKNYPLSEVKNIRVLFEIPKFETALIICPMESSISAKASPNRPLSVWKDHFEPRVENGI